jgi:hypothetical protein
MKSRPGRTLPKDHPSPRQETRHRAVGRSILVIIWHLLQDPDARFHDLGADHFSRRTNPDTRKYNHVHQLEAPRLHRHPHTSSLNFQVPTHTNPPDNEGCIRAHQPQSGHLIFGSDQNPPR